MRPRDLDHPYSQNIDGDGCADCGIDGNYILYRGKYLCERCISEREHYQQEAALAAEKVEGAA